jgi:histidine triad (HIT) family protein
MKNVFLKIIDGELPCDKVYENERIIAFKDIAPVAPVHILIVPKKPISNLDSVTKDDSALLGEMMVLASELAKKFGVEDGYRLLTNNGKEAGQCVFQLHFHLIGGRRLGPMA